MSDNSEWRYLLWVRHGCSGPALYGDDGEMMCNACGIDFKRWSAAQISTRFVTNNLKRVGADAEGSTCE